MNDDIDPAALNADEDPRAVIRRLEAELAATRARLAEVELLADYDALAPVLNRRAFLRELQRTAAYCERYGADAVLIFLDLDGFKAVNDTFGHAAGDETLRAVASVLSQNIRESDVLGRLGGDEFGVILAQVGKEKGAVKAAALARAIAEANIVVDGRRIVLGASFGVRAFEKGITAPEMMAQADAAMFVHKGRRNKTV
jgi:diguanylate cyclase (GGDEF)-like protein